MPYCEDIKAEAKDVAELGSAATVDELKALYLAILFEWFSLSKGYIIDYQVLNGARKPGRKSFFVRRTGAYRGPHLIVELKRSAKWNDAGRKEVLEGLTKSIQTQFEKTPYNTIYGLGAIGLHWTVYKMEKDGLPVLTTVMNWRDDISSDLSHDCFEVVADLVYNIH